MMQKKSVDIVEIGILEMLLAVVKRKKFVSIFTLIIATLITILCFVIPQKWASNALISPIADNTQNIRLSENVFNSFSNAPLLASQKLTMAIDFITIIDSRTFKEDLIRKFNIINYLSISQQDTLVAMDIALRDFNKNIFRAALDDQSITVKITIITKDKQFSKDIADYTIASLEKYIKYQKKEKSTITREFLEQRTMEIKARIDSLMTVKKKLESSGKTFSINQQTISSLNMYSELVSQKMLNDINLEMATKQYGKSNPKVSDFETKRDILNLKIKDLEKNNSNTLPDFVLNLSELPDLNMQFEGIDLSLNIMNKVYEFLYPRLEDAKLDELKNMPSIEVLDKPSLTGLHAYPQRLLLITMISIAALLFACLVAIIDEFLADEQREYLRAIMNELRFSKKHKHPQPDKPEA